MEMLLSKSQKSGMMGLGSIIFVLDIKARLTDEEAALVKRYKMGSTVLYEKVPGVTGLANKMGTMASIGIHLAAKALQLSFTVDELLKGRTIECKDITEMMAAKAQIEEAAENFHQILVAAKNFEGEEVKTYNLG